MAKRKTPQEKFAEQQEVIAAHEKLLNEVNEFNNRYPVGTRFKLWPHRKETIKIRGNQIVVANELTSKTRSKAFLADGKTPAVFVESYLIPITINSIQPINN